MYLIEITSFISKMLRQPSLKPTRLCLSGGGIRTISYLGALEVFESEGLLRDIKEYLGVSAGAFIGFLFCIGYSLTEMKTIMSKFDFGEIRSISPEKLLEYDENFGVDDGEGLMKLFASLLKIKGLSPDLKFLELPSNKHLRIFASDLNTQSVREFSKIYTPQIKISDALRASMSLPFYFTPVRDSITNNLLTDGGVIANYPMVHLNNFEAQDALGLTFDDHERNSEEVKNILSYFHKIMSCFWIKENREIYSRYSKNTVIIPCSTYPSWNFEATDEDKAYLFKCGQTAAKNFLYTQRTNKVKFRRRSVS